MRRTSEEEKKKNREDSDEDEDDDSDATSVASTKFSYYSINSTCSEKSRKQARLSNYAFCIQVRTWLHYDIMLKCRFFSLDFLLQEINCKLLVYSIYVVFMFEQKLKVLVYYADMQVFGIFFFNLWTSFYRKL